MGKVDPVDISQRMFVDALKSALLKCDGKMAKLSERLKLESRTKLYTWSDGHMPPYSTMQKVYFKLLEIRDGE